MIFCTTLRFQPGKPEPQRYRAEQCNHKRLNANCSCALARAKVISWHQCLATFLDLRLLRCTGLESIIVQSV
jgi:hypothetical protein